MKSLQRASSLFIIACLPLALISLNLPPPARAQQVAPPRPNPDTVVLTVTVLTMGRSFVEGLEKSYFTVFDNDKPQEVTFFKGEEDEPASVGILLDASGSMKSNRTEKIGAALARFIREGNPENDYFLIGFNDRAQLLADWTRDGQEILSRITAIKPQRYTALYDACYLGIEKLRNGKYPKRALLLISDGADNESRYTFKELREALRNSEVTLYSVGIFGSPVFSGARRLPPIPGLTGRMSGSEDSLKKEGQAVLNELSSISGGAASFPGNKKKIGAALDAIAVELRHQYLLGFKAPGARGDGKWHQLKVKLTLPDSDLTVRTREGYYAAGNLP